MAQNPPIDPRRVVDLSRLRQPEPIKPIVVNLQFHLIGDQASLQADIKELVTLLQRISDTGQQAMERHNEEIRKARQNGHDADQQNAEGQP